MGIRMGTPAVAAVERLLNEAYRRGASDLHLDPTEQGLQATIRCDGVLDQLETLPAELAATVVGRLKALAELLAYRTDTPQEGRVAAAATALGAEMRVATFPTLLGERVAIRFDRRDGAPRCIAGLGLPADVAAALQHAVKQPDGAILLTGPSGSGKTTTLYACMQEIAGLPHARTLFTIEDPIERRMQGITQTQINPAADFTFARALRSLLRQDPDVILVGEIRDKETADVALEAGLTGHLVASTIHAGTPVHVFARLLELGVEPFVITTAIRGVLAQRLVRRLDPSGRGFQGRVPLAAWLPMTTALRKAVLRRADADELAHIVAATEAVGLRAQAARLVAAGVTTEGEIARVLGSD